MKHNAFRSIFVFVALASALLFNNGASVAAAASIPAMQTAVATSFKCYYAGIAYPLGSRRNLLPPIEGYWQCQLVAVPQPGGVILMRPEWVLYLT